MKIQDNAALVTARFKTHPKFNKAESDKQKRPVYDEIEIVELKFAGNKNTVAVYPAHDFAEWTENPETGEREQITYAMKYNAQYRAFKDGGVQLTTGTPLEALTFVNAGKRLELKALGVHTVEALASIDGQPLKQLGMGGRDLKNQAIAYLEEAHPVDEEMAQIVAAQGDEIAQLKAQLAELKGDPLDHDKNGKKGGTATDAEPVANPLDAMTIAQLKTYAEEHQIDLGDATKKDEIRAAIDKAGNRPPSPFDDFEDQDLRNWLEAAGVSVDGRWGRETLITKADETNSTLAADKKVA